MLVFCDGAPGLIGAAEVVFPHSLRQRCLVHRARNLLAKVPSRPGRGQGRVLADFDDIDQPAGQAAVDEATHRAQAFADRYQRLYPSAVACLTFTLAELTVHLRFPVQRWRRNRHSNFIERTFGETRRRVKVIGRLPGEASCLSLVWAVLDRAPPGAGVA